MVLLTPQHRQGPRSTPQSIAARWGAVALQVNQLHHANSGVTWKTLANYKANAKAALFWYRNEQGLPLRGTPLQPEWKKLRRRLKDRSRLAKLSGLIRYCSLKRIAPSAVDELRSRRLYGLQKRDHRACRGH